MWARLTETANTASAMASSEWEGSKMMLELIVITRRVIGGMLGFFVPRGFCSLGLVFPLALSGFRVGGGEEEEYSEGKAY